MYTQIVNLFYPINSILSKVIALQYLSNITSSGVGQNWTRVYKVQYYNEDIVKKRRLDLDLMYETRSRVVARFRAYKQRMCQAYNQMVAPHSFQVCYVIWKKVQPAGEVSKLKPH